MKFWFLVLLIGLSGCVTNPEVKQASAEIKVALVQLDEANSAFLRAYLAELEETRQLVGRAIVASAVVRRATNMANEEAQGDLIAISSALSSEREAYRALVNEVLQIEPDAGGSEDETVESLLEKRVTALRISAAALEAAGDASSAQALRERATELDASIESLEDYEDLKAIVTLTRTKQDAAAGIRELSDYIKFLKLIHGTVNEWIVTDVTVKGDDIANLIEKHQKLLTGDGS